MNLQGRRNADVPSIDDAPYALRSPEVQARRRAMLSAPHIVTLEAYVDRIRATHPVRAHVPSLDPCDGGDQARVLLLLEAPRPQAVRSGFVSRNNPDPTAHNLLDIPKAAGLPRRDTALWNVVPWYLGDGERIRPATAKDVEEASELLRQLLALLPRLEEVVLVGRQARRVQPWLRNTFLQISCTDHHEPVDAAQTICADRRLALAEPWTNAARVPTHDSLWRT